MGIANRTQSRAERLAALPEDKRALFAILLAERDEAAAGGVTASLGNIAVLGGAGSAADPVVLVHPIGGGIYCYAELSRLLPDDRPVWAVAADGLLAGDPAVTVERLAARYVDQILRAGRMPGALVGWSFGGLVAYEMARVFAAGPHPTPPVMLLDTMSWPSEIFEWDVATTTRHFVLDLLRSSGVAVDERRLDAIDWRQPTPDALAAAKAELGGLGAALGFDVSELVERHVQYTNATRAMQRYRPHPHSGRVSLIHALDSDVRPDEWRAVVGGPLSVAAVPGDHYDIVCGSAVQAAAEAIAGLVAGSAPRPGGVAVSAQRNQARAAIANRLRPGVGGQPDAAITRRPDRHEPVPLSHAQQRLWLMEQLFPGSPAYNVPLAYRLRGPLEAGLLRRAFTEILRRHEALRTSVHTGDDAIAVQRVGEPLPVTLPIIDVADLDEACDLAGRHAREPFDLRRGPLLRAELLRLTDDDHILLLVVHHLAGDYWTLNVITEELSTLYEAWRQGRPPALPELPVQYADFTVWERAQASDAAEADALAYWRRQLAELTPLELPADRPRPPVQSFRGARVGARIGPEVTARLRAVAGARDATLFMALLAGFQAVLARWSGQDDIAVGSVIADRPRPELEPLAGFFINTLVLRGDLSGAPTFADLLARARATVLAAHDHQGVHFDRLVKEIDSTGDLSRPPLFNVALSYLSAPDPDLRLSGATVAEFRFDPGIVRFDLDIFLREDLDGVRLDIDYCVDLYDRDTVERLLDHVIRLLDTASAAPDAPVRGITLSGAAELATLRRFGERPAAHPEDRLVPELVAEHARRHPGRVAVIDGDRELTYGELDARAGRLAARLRASGAGRDILVGVCLPRSAELVVALLAVLRAGSAYLPLDPDYPAERLAFMLTDSAAPVLVTTAALAARLPTSGLVVLTAADPEADVVEAVAAAEPSAADSTESDLAEAGAPRPEDLAYAIYTSGSTGVPKGVLIEHRGLLNLCHWHNSYHKVTAADAASLLAAQSFDAAVWELWPYLVAGARVCVVDPEVRTDPARLAAWLRATGVTVSFLPTPLAEMLLADDACADLPLRRLLTGGDTLRRRPRAGAPFVLVNHYGPTECSVVATAGPAPDATAAPGPISIGGPIDNVEALVLDGELRRAPLGVAGELHLGGAGLARGYLGRPDLTDERFIPNPHGEAGSRLYRTGDLVRWRNDGTLEFLGRVDRQVKIRGQRIEPGEIEARLVEHPDVAEAVVVAHDVGAHNRQLAGYLTARAGRQVNPAELRGWLRARLPEAMVPAYLLVLDRLPLAPSGKLDRAALPDPVASDDRQRVAPRNDLERRVAEIWAEVFEQDPASLGVEDDFFDLGGHSLLATRVVSRVRQEFGVELALHSLFQARTVARFAADILAPRIEARDADVTRRLLAHLDALPTQQAQQLLAAIGHPSSRPTSQED